MSRNAISLITGQALGLVGLLLLAACGGDKSSDDGRDGTSGATSGGASGSSAMAGAGGVSTGSGGSSAGSGGMVCVDPSDSCAAAPVGAAADTVLYDGVVNDMCATGIAAPRTGYWFGYGDSTAGATRTQAPKPNGRDGADDCAMHTTGSGFANYGAGVGFDLNYANETTCPYDASSYTGIRAYLKGTTSGTRAASYAPTPNSVRMKIVTSDDKVCPETDRSGGDDFGGWCTINETDWTVCEVPFDTATREGFNMTYMATALDPTKLIKVQFEFAKEEMSGPVEFDVWIDDIEFY